MFCSNCGEKAAGRFCSHCGTPVVSSSFGGGSEEGADWKDESRYQVLLHFPEVRDLIARHAPPETKGLTGEDLLKICDTFTRPLTGLPISISKLTSVVVPIYARLGIQTGAARTETLQAPIGKMLVAAVCSLRAGAGRSNRFIRARMDVSSRRLFHPAGGHTKARSSCRSRAASGHPGRSHGQDTRTEVRLGCVSRVHR